MTILASVGHKSRRKELTVDKTNSRSDNISFLKKQRGEPLNYKTNTTILEESNDYIVAKVINNLKE
ncbi:hypothetical protein [Sphingobacterium sp. ML3W]|uniref:hypothetical protein n=1 Tax=Sphingobacterium sp. ML3W TaxID=1538644 RepID=UPI000B150063|nr:hypothetical protein [Sphingobacterium sp. ML3W]